MVAQKRTTRRRIKYLYLRTQREASHRFGSLQDWRIRVIFWIGALLVGLSIEMFARAAEWSSHQFARLLEISEYLPFLVTPLGMMLTVWIMRRICPESQGSGIPQVLLVLKQKYAWLRGSFLSLRVAFFKFLLTCMGLMFGASIGREGPSVHIGAALMHRIGHRGKLHKKYVDNSLIVAGGAAGVAAAFNAPMAGIVFAIEELSQSFEQRTSGTLILAIILSGVVVLALSGHYSYFGQADGSMQMPDSLYALLITSVICGFAGGFFGRLLIYGTGRIAPFLRQYPMRVAAICGLTVALLGWLTGGATFGSSYEDAKHLITGEETGGWLFPIAKFFATLVSYFSGIPGGLFSPSLATGAGLGALIGSNFPEISIGAISVVGMSGYLAAVIQRPITSFVIVLELTGNNHTLLLPLMVSAFVAYAISKLVQPDPLYDALAERLADGREQPVEPAPKAPDDGAIPVEPERKPLP